MTLNIIDPMIHNKVCFDEMGNHKGNSRYLSTKLTKPKINVDIIHGDRKLWDVFKKHHYLSEDLPLSICPINI